MRLLANENFPGVAVEALRNRGHDVVWIRTDAPGSGDREVLARAAAETRTVVTFDKGFGALAFRYGLPGRLRRDPVQDSTDLTRAGGGDRGRRDRESG
jgi:predicted nuclease of predicted toxin-antitoxin system